MQRFKRVLRAVRRSLGGSRPVNERKLGDERRAVGDWAMAARYYRNHVARNPEDFDIWVQLGHALKEAGRREDADAAYRSAEHLRPGDADLLLCRGHLAKLRNDHEAAAELYGRSFAIDANPAAARELGQISARETGTTYSEIIALAGAVDGFVDGMLGGWAVDPHQPETPAEVEILINGEVVATGVCDVDRPDLVAAGLVRRRAVGFQIDLSGVIDLAQPTDLHARLVGSHVQLVDSPLTVEVSDAHRRWSRRWTSLSPDVLRPLVARIEAEAPRTTLSVIVMAADDGSGLDDLIQSLERQWCDRWEAVLIPTGGHDLKLAKPVDRRIAADPRFRVLSAEGSGLANLLSRGVGEASGDHLAFMTSDSVLEPEAVWRILDAAQRGGDLIYWNEARIGRSVEGVERFVQRSAFSIDHFRAFPDLIGSFALRRETAVAVLRTDPAVAVQGVDAFRQASVARARTAAHVPTVLERRKAVFDGDRDPARPRVIKSGKPRKPEEEQAGRTLVVLSPLLTPQSLRQTIQAILASTDRADTDLMIVSRARRSATTQRYFDRLEGAATVWTCDNDSTPGQAVNDAVGSCARNYDNLILIDVPVMPSGAWLDPLLSVVARPEVGIVAPILVCTDGKVLSAGIGATAEGLVHSHRGVRFMTRRNRSPGWNRSLVCLREQSAAYGCLALRTETFVGAGGLDPIMSGDTIFADLCLRLARTGRRTLIDPTAVMRVAVKAGDAEPINATDMPFRARWSRRMADGDPFLDPFADHDLVTPTKAMLFAPAHVHAIDPPLRPLDESRLPMLGETSRI